MEGVGVWPGTLRFHNGTRIPGVNERHLETEHSMGTGKEQMQAASTASGLPSVSLLSQHQPLDHFKSMATTWLLPLLTGSKSR